MIYAKTNMKTFPRFCRACDFMDHYSSDHACTFCMIQLKDLTEENEERAKPDWCPLVWEVTEDGNEQGV